MKDAIIKTSNVCNENCNVCRGFCEHTECLYDGKHGHPVETLPQKSEIRMSRINEDIFRQLHIKWNIPVVTEESLGETV